MEIHSYRSVFDLERRIYRIDRIRLNPAGVPARGIVYFLVLALAVAILGAIPGLGLLINLAPWYLREVAFPGAVAAALVIVRIDGRPFHLAAVTLLRLAAAPRLLCGLARYRGCGEQWRPAPVLILSDGADARPRLLRYTGPGVVRVNFSCELRECAGWRWMPGARAANLTLAAIEGLPLRRPKVVELGAGVVLAVKSSRRR